MGFKIYFLGEPVRNFVTRCVGANT